MIKKKFKGLNVLKKNNGANTFVYQGIWGLKSTSCGLLTKNQLESARKVLVGKTKRACKMRVKVDFTFPITQKGKGARMGKGTGSIVDYTSKIKKGVVLFELFFNNIFPQKFIKDLLIVVSKKFTFSTHWFVNKYLNKL